MQVADNNFEAILSVITPVSKMSGKLKNLTDWLIEIAHHPVQVIIVHDVQDELTGPELDGLIAKLDNSQITLIHEYCGSPGSARNLGLRYAHTDWISFWDSDDRPRVREFLKLISNAEMHNSDYCAGSYEEISANGIKTHRLHNSISFDPTHLLQNPGVWRMGFNRNFIGDAKFAESRMAEDQYFLCNLDLFSGKLYTSDKVVYEYYTNFENQLTKSKSALNDIPQVLRLLLKLAQSASSSKQKFFILSVFIRVSLTGIKRSSPKVKVQICGLFFGSIKLERRKVVRITAEILKSNLFKYFSLTVTPELQVRLYGGLGNQLFQLAGGLCIAGSRKLTLEIDFNSTDGSISEYILPTGTDVQFRNSRDQRLKLYSKLCNLHLRLSTHATPNLKVRIVKIFLRSLLTLILSLRNKRLIKLLDPKGLGYSDLSSSGKYHYLLGYMQSYIWTENSDVLEQIKNMQLRNRNIDLDSLLHDVKSNKILAVHVRLGDYLVNPQFGQLSQDYYRRSIKIGLDRNEYDSIWVFSNDMLRAKSLLKFLNECSLEVNWVDDFNFSTPELLSLLSSCHGIVLANSSFGWWSARVGENSTKFVSAPNPWFADIDSPRLLIPQNWVQVNSLYGNSQT